MSSRYRGAARLATLALLLLCCKQSGDGNGASQPPQRPEPERFDLALPGNFAQLELRGEGSEWLLAPAGAKARRLEQGFMIESGPEFVVEVRTAPRPWSELVSDIPRETRVLERPDVVIFRQGDGYGFVVQRELVPEWDDSDRRRLVCRSGRGETSAPSARFSKAAVEQMVAACRSLSLPTLE